jgi:UDP-N-acetylglucosamine--N-acetylmuramyl-(pentapeptide) pyrophosphoryl-undecaprenol N-acetylglucosamine transferase
MRICLAGSGGGHVRQLLDLEPLWSDLDHFFITEDLALGRSIAEKHRTHFVPHVALGQARLGAPFRMAAAAVRNFARSAKIIARERPDVVITTGAGSVYFATLWARIYGAKIVLIDSFARFSSRSAFARIADPIAHLRIAQSEGVAKEWEGSILFDPFRRQDPPDRVREPLLFATVGATLPFDRLTDLVATAHRAGLIPEKVIAQIGVGGTRPEGLEAVETLPFDEIKAILRRADLVVCHGGTGSLITALRQGCRVIAVPRRFGRGEHYDDHQFEITSAFAARGLISVAETHEEFARALIEARARPPVSATTDPSPLIDYLRQVLKDWRGARP